jgi:D-alanyl-D-alanine carboxypeptidase (penicillin-binding protein 5/6)
VQSKSTSTPSSSSTTAVASTSTTIATPATTATSTVPATTVPASTVTTSVTTAGILTAAPRVTAAAWGVYDVTGAKWLASDHRTAPLRVGSLMKLLTAYVVQQAGDPTHMVTIPTMAIDPRESRIGVLPGERYDRALLVRAMLIVSASDAARALAVDVAGSEASFVTKMNAAAAALGLSDTVARNSMGLDATGAHSTVADLVQLTLELRKDPVFLATVQRRTAALHGHTFANTNRLLATYRGADGVKTGHTTRAGYCVVATATRDGRTLMVVVLGAPSDAARVAAATSLLDWAFAH